MSVALTSCEAGRLMVTSHTKHVPGGIWGAAFSILLDPTECSMVCQQVSTHFVFSHHSFKIFHFNASHYITFSHSYVAMFQWKKIERNESITTSHEILQRLRFKQGMTSQRNICSDQVMSLQTKASHYIQNKPPPTPQPSVQQI